MSLDLSFLNSSQLEAVKAAPGPTLIIAGPGTGKTLTLAYRIAYLISECGVNPENILAVTFTRKAAQEMRERILKISTRNSQLATHDFQLNIETFHSLGLAILREEGYQIGLIPDFRVLTESEQVELVKEVLSDLMPKESLNQAKKWVQRISEQKNLQLQLGVSLTPDIPEALFSTYEERLKALNAVDFDDLILKPLILFRDIPKVRIRYQTRFQHILVDEYQDINNAQYQFLGEICGSNVNLWIIGDADQAIYAFRGANVEHFLRFQQDHPGTRVIQLKENYRSHRTILTGAQAVIANNSSRIPSGHLTSSNPDGPPIYFFQAPDDRTEARFVVKEIEKLIGGVRMETSFEDSEAFGFSEIAVLYRLHLISHHFSESLKQAGIPYQVVGGTSLNSHSPTKYLIPCLKAVSNPHDDLSLRTLFSLIDDRFDSRTISNLIRSAREAKCSLFSFLQDPEIRNLLNSDQLGSVSRLTSFLQRFQEESQSTNLEQLVKNICRELKLEDPIKNDSHYQWSILIEPFLEGPAYQQIPRFLEDFSLMKEGETYNPKAEAITLMTVHAAKGLEFPVVFMVGLESGLFPCTEFGDEPSELEEERRLFYVGMTRAKKRLYLSCSRKRYLFGENRKNNPSQFVSEIPSEVIETLPIIQQPKPFKRPRTRQRSLFS
jgi:DNA helicase-2/ATP-dependent DNA helicase PcrA